MSEACFSFREEGRRHRLPWRRASGAKLLCERRWAPAGGRRNDERSMLFVSRRGTTAPASMAPRERSKIGGDGTRSDLTALGKL
jgi:hypothetical protein